MYNWWYSVLIVTLLAQRLYAASFIPKNERCVTAVYTALNYISFTGEPTAGLWQSRCQNRLKVTSIYAAADIYCEDDERLSGFAQLNRLCREKANIELLSRQTVAENLTDERIRHMKVVEFHEIPRSELLDYLVMVSPAYYDRTFRTIVSIFRTQLFLKRISQGFIIKLTIPLAYMANWVMVTLCLWVSSGSGMKAFHQI